MGGLDRGDQGVILRVPTACKSNIYGGARGAFMGGLDQGGDQGVILRHKPVVSAAAKCRVVCIEESISPQTNESEQQKLSVSLFSFSI